MNFYTILYKITNDVIGDVIEFDDGVCVVKYENYKFPSTYNSIEDLIDDLPEENYLLKDSVKDVID